MSLLSATAAALKTTSSATYVATSAPKPPSEAYDFETVPRALLASLQTDVVTTQPSRSTLAMPASASTKMESPMISDSQSSLMRGASSTLSARRGLAPRQVVVVMERKAPYEGIAKEPFNRRLFYKTAITVQK